MTPQELEQRMSALQQADKIRLARAEVRRKLRAGGPLSEALHAECCQTARVWDLLVCRRRVGKVKAVAILNRAGVSPNRLVKDLTDRQRAVLCEPLPMEAAA